MKGAYHPITTELIYQHFHANKAKHLLRVSWKDGIDIDEPTSDVVSLLHAYADASREGWASPEEVQDLRRMALDATAHLVAAASAYEKHASRARHLKPRAVADALFTTRLNDFKQAAARAQAACQKLTVKANK